MSINIHPLKESLETMQSIKMRFHNVAKRRYYQLYLAKDLLGEWVLTKSWGALDSAVGNVVHVSFSNYAYALKQIDILMKYRLRRGYEYTF